MLYHLSEEPNITRFDPRPHAESPHPIVWAIHPDRLRNYLFPRDCPRITFFAGPNSSSEDIARFLGPGRRPVVAFESAWLDRIRSTRLYCYHLPETTFTCTDECAGYYQSQLPVTPLLIEPIPDLLAALASQNVEIRILPNLWPLHAAILLSTLPFSMIRMRNAQPRPSTASSTSSQV